MVPYRVTGGVLVETREREYVIIQPQQIGNALFRVNVIDEKGTVSFLAPPHGLKVLAASVSRGGENFQELLIHARPYDADWADSVLRDVLLFDEHNVDELSEPFDEAVESKDDEDHPAFRVMTPSTRKRSLVPGRLGLVVFNLKERRIIQIHNSYDELRRNDRGRIRVAGEPTELMFHYALPDDWALVP